MFSTEGFFLSIDGVKSNKKSVRFLSPWIHQWEMSPRYFLPILRVVTVLFFKCIESIQFFDILESWSTRLYFLNSLHPGWHPNHSTLNFELVCVWSLIFLCQEPISMTPVIAKGPKLLAHETQARGRIKAREEKIRDHLFSFRRPNPLLCRNVVVCNLAEIRTWRILREKADCKQYNVEP